MKIESRVLCRPSFRWHWSLGLEQAFAMLAWVLGLGQAFSFAVLLAFSLTM